MTMTTGTNATSVRVVKIGDQDHTVLSSNDPWYRYLEAAANLFLAGEIDAEELSEVESFCAMIACPDRGVRERVLTDAAAGALRTHIWLALNEPDCPCDPYRTKPCGCEPMNRRRRLADLMGVPYIEPLAGIEITEVERR